MNYIQVFKDAYNLLRKTRLVWIFSVLIVLPPIGNYFLHFVNDRALKLTLMLVQLILSFTSIIAWGGLIYTIAQAINNTQITFEEGWYQGRIKWFRIIGVSIIPGLLFFITIILFVAWKKSLLSVLFSIVMIPIWIGWINFSNCGVVIKEIKPLRAVWIGLLITSNHIIKVVVLYQIFNIMRLILFGILIFTILYTPLNIHIPFPLSFDYSTYLKLLANPIVGGFNQVFDLIITPLQSIVWVIAYNQFTREISYPGLASRRAKTHP